LPVLLNPPEAMAESFRNRGRKPGQTVGYGLRRMTFSVPMGLAAKRAGAE